MSRFRIAFCATAICLAQGHNPNDLTEVGLEELMNIEVISISKREQKLARTPAAVSILTHEDTFVRPNRIGRRIYGKLTWTF